MIHLAVRWGALFSAIRSLTPVVVNGNARAGFVTEKQLRKRESGIPWKALPYRSPLLPMETWQDTPP